MIFLDQPVNVGYSYSDDGSTVDTSPVAAEDVYAFIQLFLQRYPEYASTPFHVAAESYGGTYAPNIVSVIHKQNKEAALAPVPHVKHINLASVILANGITDPHTQMASVPDYACEGPYAVYDDPEGPQCQALRSKVPTCQRLIQSCYNFNSRWTCVPAQAYCYSQLFGPLQRECQPLTRIYTVYMLTFICRARPQPVRRPAEVVSLIWNPTRCSSPTRPPATAPRMATCATSR